MEYIEIGIKLLVGLSILNVWLLRAKKETEWRGGDASNIKEEFEAYGLPTWFMYLIGGVKSLLALLLLTSIFFSAGRSRGCLWNCSSDGGCRDDAHQNR